MGTNTDVGCEVTFNVDLACPFVKVHTASPTGCLLPSQHHPHRRTNLVDIALPSRASSDDRPRPPSRPPLTAILRSLRLSPFTEKSTHQHPRHPPRTTLHCLLPTLQLRVTRLRRTRTRNAGEPRARGSSSSLQTLPPQTPSTSHQMARTGTETRMTRATSRIPTLLSCQ